MAARKPVQPRARHRVHVPRVDDAATARAFDAVSTSVQRLQNRPERFTTEVDLVVGTNRVRHTLGRKCFGYSLTPTVADATFAHALDTSNPRPDLEVWITVVGAAQPGARIEVH